jgi:hypothetical protein
MRCRSLLSTLALLLSLAATLAAAGAGPVAETRPDDRKATVPSVALDRPDDGAPAVRPLSPMMIEIEQVLENQKLAVAELRSELSRTTDGGRKIELLHTIHQLKADAELEILRVQLRYARREGRLETVQKIEEAIEYLTGPRPVPAAEPRTPPDRVHH